MEDKGSDDTEQPQMKISLGMDMGGILVRSGDITADSIPLEECSNYWLGTWEAESGDAYNAVTDHWDIPMITRIQIVASKEPGVAFEVTKTLLKGNLVTMTEKLYVYGKRVDLVDTNVGYSLNIKAFDNPESYEASKQPDGTAFPFGFCSYDMDSMDVTEGGHSGYFKRK